MDSGLVDRGVFDASIAGHFDTLKACSARCNHLSIVMTGLVPAIALYS
jgi:hypothetical protein